MLNEQRQINQSGRLLKHTINSSFHPNFHLQDFHSRLPIQQGSLGAGDIGAVAVVIVDAQDYPYGAEERFDQKRLRHTDIVGNRGN